MDSSGSYNVALGNSAGSSLKTGDKNIFIGNLAGANDLFVNTSNKLVIQNDNSKTPLIYGEFDNKKVIINGDLNVTGEINYPMIAKALKDMKYSGVIGMEAWASGDSEVAIARFKEAFN